MRNDTRAKFLAFTSQIALLNGIPDATVRFAVDPSIEQTLEERMKESSEFLQAINIVPVTQQVGQTLGLETSRTIAGRTNTAGGNRREPTDPTENSERNSYHCRQTNFDWARSYAAMDAWRHREDFELKLRNAILAQQARDRIMIGWHGEEVAAATDRVANPMLQDVNEGWLFKIRDRAPEMVLDDGALTVHADDSEDDALKAIYVKAGVDLFDEALGNQQDGAADYSSLDALVLDAKRLLPEWHRGDTDLVVIVGHDLVDDKYFNIAQKTGATATEVEATDRILRSSKQIGGLPAVRVPFFPSDAILITRLDNLSIYWQEGTRRRQLKDESEYDRIANYESVNEDYVVEDYELAVLVENIVIGESPTQGAKPAA